MSPPSDDDLGDPIDDAFAERLRAGLVHADLDAVAAQRLRARAHAALVGGRARPRLAWLAPAAAATLAAAQLIWAVGAVLDIYK
jgi:hypothetical protein